MTPSFLRIVYTGGVLNAGLNAGVFAVVNHNVVNNSIHKSDSSDSLPMSEKSISEVSLKSMSEKTMSEVTVSEVTMSEVTTLERTAPSLKGIVSLSEMTMPEMTMLERSEMAAQIMPISETLERARQSNVMGHKVAKEHNLKHKNTIQSQAAEPLSDEALDELNQVIAAQETGKEALGEDKETGIDKETGTETKTSDTTRIDIPVKVESFSELKVTHDGNIGKKSFHDGTAGKSENGNRNDTKSENENGNDPKSENGNGNDGKSENGKFGNGENGKGKNSEPKKSLNVSTHNITPTPNNANTPRPSTNNTPRSSTNRASINTPRSSTNSANRASINNSLPNFPNGPFPSNPFPSNPFPSNPLPSFSSITNNNPSLVTDPIAHHSSYRVYHLNIKLDGLNSGRNSSVNFNSPCKGGNSNIGGNQNSRLSNWTGGLNSNRGSNLANQNRGSFLSPNRVSHNRVSHNQRDSESVDRLSFAFGSNYHSSLNSPYPGRATLNSSSLNSPYPRSSLNSPYPRSSLNSPYPSGRATLNSAQYGRSSLNSSNFGGRSTLNSSSSAATSSTLNSICSSNLYSQAENSLTSALQRRWVNSDIFEDGDSIPKVTPLNPMDPIGSLKIFCRHMDNDIVAALIDLKKKLMSTGRARDWFLQASLFPKPPVKFKSKSKYKSTIENSLDVRIATIDGPEEETFRKSDFRNSDEKNPFHKKNAINIPKNSLRAIPNGDISINLVQGLNQVNRIHQADATMEHCRRPSHPIKHALGLRKSKVAGFQKKTFLFDTIRIEAFFEFQTVGLKISRQGVEVPSRFNTPNPHPGRVTFYVPKGGNSKDKNGKKAYLAAVAEETAQTTGSDQNGTPQNAKSKLSRTEPTVTTSDSENGLSTLYVPNNPTFKSFLEMVLEKSEVVYDCESACAAQCAGGKELFNTNTSITSHGKSTNHYSNDELNANANTHASTKCYMNTATDILNAIADGVSTLEEYQSDSFRIVSYVQKLGLSSRLIQDNFGELSFHGHIHDNQTDNNDPASDNDPAMSNFMKKVQQRFANDRFITSAVSKTESTHTLFNGVDGKIVTVVISHKYDDVSIISRKSDSISSRKADATTRADSYYHSKATSQLNVGTSSCTSADSHHDLVAASTAVNKRLTSTEEDLSVKVKPEGSASSQRRLSFVNKLPSLAHPAMSLIDWDEQSKLLTVADADFQDKMRDLVQTQTGNKTHHLPSFFHKHLEELRDFEAQTLNLAGKTSSSKNSKKPEIPLWYRTLSLRKHSNCPYGKLCKIMKIPVKWRDLTGEHSCIESSVTGGNDNLEDNTNGIIEQVLHQTHHQILLKKCDKKPFMKIWWTEEQLLATEEEDAEGKEDADKAHQDRDEEAKNEKSDTKSEKSVRFSFGENLQEQIYLRREKSKSCLKRDSSYTRDQFQKDGGRGNGNTKTDQRILLEGGPESIVVKIQRADQKDQKVGNRKGKKLKTPDAKMLRKQFETRASSSMDSSSGYVSYSEA